MQQVYSLSLGWYPNDHLRFLLQFSHIGVDRLNATGATQVRRGLRSYRAAQTGLVLELCGDTMPADGCFPSALLTIQQRVQLEKGDDCNGNRDAEDRYRRHW
jgi:hypothetical protein